MLSRIPSVARLHDFVVDDIASSGPADVLDVGCGPGNVDVMLAKSGNVGHVYGVDPSKAMVALAKRKARDLDNATFALGSSRHIPFEKRFDIIFSSISFHHWSGKAHSLLHLSFFLKKRGEIRIYEFDGDRCGATLKLILPSHVVYERDLHRVAEEAGLKIRETIRINNFIKAVFIKE